MEINIFTIILFTVLLICILIGVGLGFYLAYVVAYNTKIKPSIKLQHPDINTKKTKRKKGEWLPNKKDSTLSTKIHKQTGQSYAEFDCNFTGEDPSEKLDTARKKQDASYNCLKK